MSEYWILKWITAEELTSLEQAKRRLVEPGGLERLVEFAAEQASAPIPVIPAAANQLVGGRGMDLSGVLECPNSKCIKKKVDEVLYRTWHYFDRVVVNGLDSRRFMESLRYKDSMAEKIIEQLTSHIDVAFYVRESSAESALIFCDRQTHFCQKCVDRDAAAAGFSGSLEQARQKLTDSLYIKSKITQYTKQSGDKLYMYEHPALDTVTFREYSEAPFPELEDFARDIARSQAEIYVAHAIRSAAIAHWQSAALGQLSVRDEGQLAELAARPTSEEVAFNLQLPVVQSLPISPAIPCRAARSGLKMGAGCPPTS